MMSTLTKSKYSQLSREELIRLLEARDKEQKANVNRTSSGFPNIKRIISEVLVLLFNEEEQPIEKSMRLLLNFFEAGWSPEGRSFRANLRNDPVDYGYCKGRTRYYNV